MRYGQILIYAMVVAVVSATSVGHSFADEKIEGAINARKALMTLYAINLRQLGDMAKGKQAYDPGKAKTAAENLRDLASMNNGVVWPQGSDSTAFPGKTRAKVEAWTTYPASRKLQEALIAAASDMADTADAGVDSVSERIGAIGKSCGGCHKAYREPK